MVRRCQTWCPSLPARCELHAMEPFATGQTSADFWRRRLVVLSPDNPLLIPQTERSLYSAHEVGMSLYHASPAYLWQGRKSAKIKMTTTPTRPAILTKGSPRSTFDLSLPPPFAVIPQRLITRELAWAPPGCITTWRISSVCRRLLRPLRVAWRDACPPDRTIARYHRDTSLQWS